MRDALLVTRESVYKLKIDESNVYLSDDGCGISPKNFLPQMIIEAQMSNEAFFKQPTFEFVQPDNCKIFLSNPSINKFWFVIEQPPQFRTIKVQRSLRGEIRKLLDQGKLEAYGFGHLEKTIGSDNENSQITNFNIFLPYCIFVVLVRVTLASAKNVQMEHALSFGLRKTPLKSLEDSLFLSPLTNVYDDCRVCTGVQSSEVLESVDFAKVVNKVVSNFWNTNFNNDVNGSCLRYVQDYTSNLDLLSWSYYSQINPMFIFNENFKGTQKLSDIVKGWGYYPDGHTEIPLDCDSSKNIFTQKLYYRAPKEIIITSQKTNKSFSFRVDDVVTIEDVEYTVKGSSDKNNLVVVDSEGNDKSFSAEKFDRRKSLENVVIIVDDKEIEVPASCLMKCKISGKYYKIKSIEKDLDTEIVEVIANNKRMLLNENILRNWEMVNDINFNGVLVSDDKAYSLFSSSYIQYNFPIWEMRSTNEKLKSIDEHNGNIVLLMSNYNLELNNSSYFLIPNDEELEWYSPIAFGNKLLGTPAHEFAYYKNRILVRDRSFSENTFNKRMLESIMPDPKTIYVKSFVHPDIDLKVDDEVVAIQPDGSKFFGKIEAFQVENKDNYSMNIYVHVTNGQGETKRMPYIVTNGHYNSIINAGDIRKIDYAYKGFEVGKRFRLLKKVKCFLKINLYEIEGVITDSYNHMVLFTNGQTVYTADMLDLFEEVPPKSPMFNRKINTDFHIEYQLGDIVVTGSGNHKYFIACYHGDPKTRYWHCTQYHQSTKALKHENSRIYGIPVPRFLDDDLVEIAVHDVDYRGGFLCGMVGRQEMFRGLVERRLVCSK